MTHSIQKAKMRQGSLLRVIFMPGPITLPNMLTLSRIILIPLILGLFYMKDPWGSWLAGTLFVIACITDFLDGYFARTLKQSSSFGQFLDPVADKLLVSSALLMLASFGRIDEWTLIPAIIILCREIMVSGLREFLAHVEISVPVSRLAKWKTGIQMTALSILIIHRLPFIPDWLFPTAGSIGLWIAGALTLITGYDYFRAGMKHFDN